MADYVNIPMSVAVDTVALSTTVAGNLVIGGEIPVLQSKTVYPSASDQAIEPDTGYDGLEDVTVKAVVIENLSAANIVSGVTVKVGDAVDDDRIASVTGTAQTGIVPTGTLELTSNGTENCSAYEYVDVDVANSYTAGDEGKVVRSGALVSQTSATYTQNSTYDTTTVNSVTVQVEGGGSSTLGTKTINNNGTYNASDDSLDGYSQVTVSVPASAVDSGTKSITANGNNQDVVGYAAVNVSVPNSYSAGDEGKVVSSGALVAQTAHADVTPTTSDQTIDTTLNNSLKVKGDADLVSGNIKKDVDIFGVTGSYEGGGGSGEEAVLQSFIEGTATGAISSTVLTNINCIATFRAKAITSVNMPNVISAAQDTFYQCEWLTSVSMPKLQSVGSTCFGYSNNNNFKNLALPSLKTIGSQAFRNMKLIGFDCLGGSTGTFGANAFVGCSALQYFVIRADTVYPLSNINSFSSTLFDTSGTGGTLYVPDNLISQYTSSSNWSTIIGRANNQIKSIESTHTDPNAPIDLTLYYIDGTPIPT